MADEDEYDYEEEEDSEGTEVRFPSCNTFQRTVPWGIDGVDSVLFKIDGVLTGDINFNSCHGVITIVLSNYITLQMTIASFTGNCGVKTISYPYCLSQYDTKFMKIIESFLYYCCNCGIVVGSDWVSGSMSRLIQSVGNYTITEPVWNPNYTTSPNHKILLFYKYLDKNALVDYWG